MTAHTFIEMRHKSLYDHTRIKCIDCFEQRQARDGVGGDCDSVFARLTPGEEVQFKVNRWSKDRQGGWGKPSQYRQFGAYVRHTEHSVWIAREGDGVVRYSRVTIAKNGGLQKVKEVEAEKIADEARREAAKGELELQRWAETIRVYGETRARKTAKMMRGDDRIIDLILEANDDL